MTATLQVTVTDATTGQQIDQQTVTPGDYAIICNPPCRLYGSRIRDNGTHLLTITGHIPTPQEAGDA